MHVGANACEYKHLQLEMHIMCMGECMHGKMQGKNAHSPNNCLAHTS